MRVSLDPRLVAVVGSEIRSAVLSVLAAAHGPLTGYRIAATGGVSAPKAHVQLHRLARAGVVERQEGGWVLADARVRNLLRGSTQAVGWDDWTTERGRRARAGEKVLASLAKLAHAQPPSGWTPRDPERFVRSPVKDRMVERQGHSRSHHAR